MPDVPFCHDGWNFLDYPPYAGEWWAVTRHRTVERVSVDTKEPPAKGDPFLLVSGEPFVYVFSETGALIVETVARRRWTHWMPVLPPAPPLDLDPVASGLADPTPGPRVCEFRRDPGHGPPKSHVFIDWAAEQRTIAEESRFMAEQQQAEQDRMDQEDASSYNPDTFANFDVFKPVTPNDLMEAAKAVAGEIVSLPADKRVAALRRIARVNPFMGTLVRGLLDGMRKR